MGYYSDAEERATKYVEQYPKSYDGWELLGRCKRDLDKLDEAQMCFEKAIAIDPGQEGAYIGKGTVHSRRGDFEKAEALYLKVLEINPDCAQVYLSLMTVEYKRGNLERALEYGDIAWSIRQDSSFIASNLAIVYHDFGVIDKRDYFYKEAEKLGCPHIDVLKEKIYGND